MEAEERIVKAERHDGHLKSVMTDAVRGLCNGVNSLLTPQDSAGVLHLPHEIEAGPVEYKRTLVHASDERLVHLTSQMKWRLREGE